MSFITTFNSVTYFLIVVSLLVTIAHIAIYKTGGYTFEKLVKTVHTTSVMTIVLSIITIGMCFIDLRATCTFMLWSTIATAPIGIALHRGVKKQIKKLLADAAEINSQYPQAYQYHEVDGGFEATK